MGKQEEKAGEAPVTAASMEAAIEHTAQEGIEKLAAFLQEYFPQEIGDEGAVDMAIRLLGNVFLEQGEGKSESEYSMKIDAEVIKAEADADPDEGLDNVGILAKILGKKDAAENKEPYMDDKAEPSDVVEHGEAGQGLADPPPPGVLWKVQVREPKANLRDGPDKSLAPKGFLLQGDMAFAMEARDFDGKDFLLLSVPQFAGDEKRGRPLEKTEGWVLAKDVEVIQG